MYFQAIVKKKFKEFAVDAAISASKGEFVSILGPSGSGKTTVLSLIAGLLDIDEGKILLDGRDLSMAPPEKRNFGMVFQDKLLFPHMSVLKNVEFGLRMHGMDLGMAKSSLKAVGMDGKMHRDVVSLSGGERQRVAIARAVAYSPDLLLLDEPLKELDAVVREGIKLELKRLQRELRMTALYVTHDVEEAFYLSDKVYLLHGGKVVQEGEPLEVFQHPANQFVRKYFSPYLLLKMKGKYLLARKTSFHAPGGKKH
ncbi:MAG TPA: ABC transporter ATP-binding protein [Candidatus Norongarragalinales archaeon]|nr:ABC transporter ATP-binding protein [Candidatus Norongarragalinales archaeon]